MFGFGLVAFNSESSVVLYCQPVPGLGLELPIFVTKTLDILR